MRRFDIMTKLALRHQLLALAIIAQISGMILLSSSTWQQASAQEIRIGRPLAQEVIQRQGFRPLTAHEHNPHGPELGFADVGLQFEGNSLPADCEWEYRVERLSNAIGPALDWQPLDVRRNDPSCSATARVAAGGWYRLKVRASVAGQAVASGDVEPIGVGEVFLIAGQSYAAGENDAHLKITDPERRIVRFDWQRDAWQVANDPFPHVGDGGTIWPAVGDLLQPIVRVPIGFVNVAASGSASRQWLPGTPFFERLAAAGGKVNRFRFVLWQQGESDVLDRTSAEQYVENLTRIRSALNERWETDATWLLAKSTLHPTVYNDPQQEATIRSAIDLLCKEPGFHPGPDTDILGGENRGDLNSRRHFTELGQKRAASMWFAAIWNELQFHERR